MPIEAALRVLFYVVIGFILLTAIYWFGHSVYKSFFSTELVIAPFQVIGGKDDNERLGSALAYMLQARLTQIQLDLERSQRDLLPVRSDANDRLGSDPRVLALPIPIIRSNENTTFAILDTPNLNVSVGGVEVGGFFPWLQRTIVKERSLRLSVYREGDKAVIAGDLSPFLRSDNNALWIETEKGTPDEIASSVAYELIHRKLSQDPTSSIRALDSGEFRSLLAILFELADLNQKVVVGRTVKDRYADLFFKIEKIALRVPQWYELITLTAKVAESAENNERALAYYKQALELIKQPQSNAPASDEKPTEEKIAALAGKTGGVATTQTEQSFLDAAKNYSQRLGLSSPEPKISFVKPDIPEVFGLWNEKNKQYEVNPDKINTPGLAENTALEARFLSQHFEKCFGKGDNTPPEVLSFWNDFRHSVIDYIVSTEPNGDVAGFGRGFDWQLSKVLKQMETLQGNSQPVRTLALKLLDRYGCDWTKANFLEKALAVNQEFKIMPDKVIQDAVAAGLKR